MAQKQLNGRIALKHDLEINWQNAAARSNFTPNPGEVIIYDPDENHAQARIKIGDGVRNVEELPFHAGSWNDLSDKPFGETNPIEITWDGVIGDNFVIQEWAGFGDYYLGDYGITDYTQLLGSTVKLGDDTYTLDYCEPPEYTDGYYELKSNEESYAKVRLVTENNADNWPIGVYFYYTPDTYVSYLKTNSSIKTLDSKYIGSDIARVDDIPDLGYVDTALANAAAALENVSGLIDEIVEAKADWNQNDENAVDYIKNRPFYVDGYVEQLTLEGSDFNQFREYHYSTYIQDLPSMEFIPGEKYTITINDNVYECVAQEQITVDFAQSNRAPGTYYNYLGETNIVSERYDEPYAYPFFIGYENSYNQEGYFNLDITVFNTSEIESFKICQINIQKIDKKYLPDDALIQSNWNQNDEAAPDHIKNRPFYTGDLIETEFFDINAKLAELGEEWIDFETADGERISNIRNALLPMTDTGIEVGKEYTISINGVKYTSIAKDISENTDIPFSIITLGDGEAVLETLYNGSHLPDDFTYGIVTIGPEGTIVACLSDGNPTEYKILTQEQEIIKIDPKYLPAGIGYGDEVLLVDNLTYDDYNDGNFPRCTFIAGEKYTITIDGNIYSDIECIADGRWKLLTGTLVNGAKFSIDDDGGNGLYIWVQGGWSTISILQGSIHRIDPKYLPDDIGGSADWNVNDPEAAGYIKNRPFYTGDLIDVELASIDESEWEEMTQIDDTRSEWIFSRTPNFGLVVGQEYKVIYNGITYIYNARQLEGGAIAIGDSQAMEDVPVDKDMFCIIDDPDNFVIAIGVYSSAPTEFKIYKREQEIIKIDPKYIKDMYYEEEPIINNVVPETSLTFEGDMGEISSIYNELSYMLEEGITYIVNWNGIEYTCISRSDGDGSFYIGNQNISDWFFPETINSNEPFFIATYAPDNWSTIYAESGTHTFTITTIKETIHRIDPKYLPEGGFGYDEVGYAVILPETEVGCYNDQDGAYWGDLVVPDLIRGETYTVIWDGVEYSCVAEDDGYGGEKLGNFALAGVDGDTGEPFFIYEEGNGAYSGIAASTEGTHTITISGPGIIVHTIDSKYLPQNVYVNVAEELDDGTEIASHSPFELWQAYNNGQKIFFEGHEITNLGDSWAYFEYISSDLYNVVKYVVNIWDDKRIQRETIKYSSPTERVDAKVGQIIVVKKVDENGKPVSWEAIDRQKVDYTIYTDQYTGYEYIVSIENGSLVSKCKCQSIQVITQPTKMSYTMGETFDSTGMTVQVTCQDGSTYQTDLFTCDESVRGNSVNIYYNDGGTVFSTTIDVTTTPFDPVAQLIDFNYTVNNDGTYSITGWKGTYNGEQSTEMIFPNNSLIIV